MDSSGPPTLNNRFYAINLHRFKEGSTDKLVAENVTHGSDGLFRCAIVGPGSCPFALPKMIQFTFACHFLRSHPQEALEKGFVEKSGESPPLPQPVSLSKFVVRTERGFCCRIDPNLTCDYVQGDQVSAQDFKRHFRLAHPALARKHGFYRLLQSQESRSILKSMIQQSVEDSTADNAEPPSKRKLVEVVEDSEESSSDVILLDPSDENVWLDVPSDKPSEYCRLCFSIARPAKPIFSAPDDTASSVAALIEECTGVRLAAGDDFPAAICHDCSEKLHDIKCFRVLCETLNRVVHRNRATFTAKTPEIEPEPPVTASPSSPPPLVPFEESVANLFCDESMTENEDEDCVVELSDSDQDDAVEDTPQQETNSTAVCAEETDETLPYIALQDDWFCCKQCNQIHHTLDVMVDHLHNYHSELGFFAKPKPAAPQVNKKKRKKRRTKKAMLDASIVDYQQIVIDDKTYFKCNDCDTLLSQKGNMNRHEKCYHNGTEQRSRLFCQVVGCSKNFMDRMGLTRHLKLQHGINKFEKIVALQVQSEVEML
uniref:C2H2-type domain-containing protein n=1 Tax=Culex tarsalis TaxID=7177 RepID=A0A1Q3EXJ5_CULTA